MVRQLLADRFALRTHIERREVPVYQLVLARADGILGPRIQKSDLNCEPFLLGERPIDEAPRDPQSGYSRCATILSASDGLAEMRVGGIPLTRLAGLLQNTVGRFVVDRTGLDGTFDIEITYVDTVSTTASPRDGVVLSTAIQEQLGLRFRRVVDVVDVLVIDHATHPSPN
jgi:uncharacterized protein (TIGR03435 family)